jgi:hypothetical protein
MLPEAQTESLEESIFKTLSNQKRRDILRFIGERRQASFSEIKKAADIDDSSSVSYHLRSLQGLVIQRNEKYVLSELGQEAYNLIVKTNAYTTINVAVRTLRRQVPALIVANALLWVAAYLVAARLEGDLTPMTSGMFVVLWFVSTVIIYSIVSSISRDSSCRSLFEARATRTAARAPENRSA